MDPLSDDGQAIFPIDKERKRHCEYEYNSFTVRKTHPSDTSWKFVSDHGSGYADCNVGYVETMHINEEARRCGLGSIFLTLCLIDKDMNGVNGNVKGDLEFENEALLKIRWKHPEKGGWVDSYCHSFWALEYSDDKSEANAYFKAAVDAGFTKMLISDDEGASIHGPKNTKHWKETYDQSTGKILRSIDVTNADWFFCKPSAELGIIT